MGVLDSRPERRDGTSVLPLPFAFVAGGVGVDGESLKATVFRRLGGLPWELEVCCDCGREPGDGGFEGVAGSGRCLRGFLAFAGDVLGVCLEVPAWVGDCC